MGSRSKSLSGPSIGSVIDASKIDSLIIREWGCRPNDGNIIERMILNKIAKLRKNKSRSMIRIRVVRELPPSLLA